MRQSSPTASTGRSRSGTAGTSVATGIVVHTGCILAGERVPGIGRRRIKGRRSSGSGRCCIVVSLIVGHFGTAHRTTCLTRPVTTGTIVRALVMRFGSVKSRRRSVGFRIYGRRGSSSRCIVVSLVVGHFCTAHRAVAFGRTTSARAVVRAFIMRLGGAERTWVSRWRIGRRRGGIIKRISRCVRWYRFGLAAVVVLAGC